LSHPQALVGIIGGTGLGDVLAREAGGRAVEVDTPFGRPSSPPILADWEGVKVAFIGRHGPGHAYNPSEVPYRANIFALKVLGVSYVIASGATGSLREDFEPGQLVICDQVIDKTFRRASTFFGGGIVAHVEMADPFCPMLRRVLIDASEGLNAGAGSVAPVSNRCPPGVNAGAGSVAPVSNRCPPGMNAGARKVHVHHAGTYVCMEGPQFSTRAESRMHRAWGGDVIGMTAMPEAKLAREAELCYAMVALPTDYDCWKPHSAASGQAALLKEILANLQTASRNAIALIRAAVGRLAECERSCGCSEALKLAIWSDRSGVDEATRRRLAPLIDRYFE